MAYQIDFTASNWGWRSRRKLLLRILLLAAVGGVVYGVHHVYKVYNQPTLNMKLAEYEAVAYPLEEINAALDEVSKAYGAMLHYYRLAWASSPTNFLNAMASADTPRLGRRFRPQGWTMSTGGKCEFRYRYEFGPGDKAEQTRGIESEVVSFVTSAVEVVSGKVEVQGVRHENLLNVEGLDLLARFSLPGAMSFPKKVQVLADRVNEIEAMRKRVQDTKVPGEKDVSGLAVPVRDIMMEYLPKSYEKRDGKELPDFPGVAKVINVSGWFARADKFIAANSIPVAEARRKKLNEAWNAIGDARLPWKRYRVLDNDEIVDSTRAMSADSDGVKLFKAILDQRRVDCRKKLEPLAEAYEHNDVFNKPLVEADLRDRVAKAAGVSVARVEFRDESGADPAILDNVDETFTFTWVRWKLLLGNAAGKGEERDAGTGERITLEMVADCAKRAVELGPGYALDNVKVDFDSAGNVSAAVLDGLLPVKKSAPKRKGEPNKEANANVN